MYPPIRNIEISRGFIPRRRAVFDARSVTRLSHPLLLALALTCVLKTARGQGASVGGLTTIHTFQGAGDGGVPSADLMLAADGNLYGTTIGLVVKTSGSTGLGPIGGSGNYGTIFRVTPATGTFATIHTFELLPNGVPLDGTSPRGGLVQGGSGNVLYGTTSGVNETITEVFNAFYGFFDFTFTNSATGNGSVYKLDITNGGSELTTLYTFGGATDGRAPVGSLILGSSGPLYGTTSGGSVFAPPGESLASSAAAVGGSVFSITNTGVLTALADFGVSLAGGEAPFSGLVEGGDGNYYGTTSSGGSVLIAGYTISNEGTVFQLTPGGISTTIYTFSGGNDGGQPAAGLARPGNGYLYGTTTAGAGGYGTVFKVTSNGTLTTIYTFGGGTDGGVPASKLIVGSDGNLYGTTSGFTILRIDGSVFTNFGTVFQITPDATGDGMGFTTLYAFQGANDGGTPLGGLVEGPNGTLYGTTSAGATGFGTVFALSVPSLGGHPSFFDDEVSVGNGVYYLAFPRGNYFGYYSFLPDSAYLYHYDLGYEYVFDANDGNAGIYLYDFASNDFFYTSPNYPFPYLFDFNLDSVVYYYPDPNNAGHYTTNPRYFYVFDTGQIITK